MTGKITFRACIAALIVGVLAPQLVAAQTLDRIKADRAFKVGYVTDAAPFSFGQAASPQGYSIALCKRLASYFEKQLAVPGLQIKYTPTSIERGLRQVENGAVDILCGSVTDTLERRQEVAFSIPIYLSGTGALVRTDAPQSLIRVLNGEVAHEGPRWRATINQGLAKHTFVVRGDTTNEEWVREKLSGLGVIATVITVDNHEEGVELVANGEADAYFADRAILTEYSRNADDVELLTVYYNYEPIALALSRGDEDMRLAVDTMLSEMYRSDEFVSLYSEYFGKPGDLTLMFFRSFARH
jgi:polar amino acid transport system substrate-binding protein